MADRADAAGVMALIGRVFEEYGFDWSAEEEFWDLLDDHFPYEPPRGQMWVVRDAGRIVGSVAVERLDQETAEFHRLYLDVALRGQGHGQALLQTAERWALAQGCRRAVLWTDISFHDAHRLYERLGYARTGHRQLADLNQSEEYCYERPLEPDEA